MLKNISWNDYTIAIVLLLVIYFVLVGLLYFSEDIKKLLSGKRKPTFRAAVPHDNRTSVSGTKEIREETGFSTATDDEFTEVEQLIERLKAVISDACHRKLIPQEFKQYLSMVLKEYPSVRYSPIRSSINELIVSECQKYGPAILHENEIEMLWKEAM